MNASPTPGPSHHPETEAFWAAAREGRFLLKYCMACGKPHWYPRELCPFCCEATEWREASGRGHLYSYSFSRKGGTTHVIAFVTLEEGPSMMTTIVEADPASLSVGQPLRVAFRALAENGPPVPVFVPA